ncbi:unnamed protein product [Allacma fusca]|uniref:Uncharacterized protein n=1 Tax=Allacma fusca TaxID=39272 RepID=A0A8J2LUX7_9HEXA|nr:unnamed protein product [Allacma fusca]
MLRVTFSTAAAPFLATNTLTQLASDNANFFPQASQVLKEDSYVDDIVTGENTEERLLSLQSDLNKITKSGGFELCKWVAYRDHVMNSIPKEVRGTLDPLCLDVDNSVKTLGIQWHPAVDNFGFKVQLHGFSYAAAVYIRSVTVEKLRYIFLAWINSASYKWKPFVANRITEIHECRPVPKWHHINGKGNPADLPSRGISPPDLQGNNLWWHGPALLHATYHAKDIDQSQVPPEALVEQRYRL